MPKRILLLTFYYPPDLSAGSFRSKALVKALLGESSEAIQIDVLTTQPNRYHAHAVEAEDIEEAPGLHVRRIFLPEHQGSMFGQVRAFLRYAWVAAKLAKRQDYDLVIATSSRLMTAVLGRWIALRQSARLYLDIRDIFVETLQELVPALHGKILVKLFGLLERWTVRGADKVNLVSPGFLGYFQPRYPTRKFSLFSNGIDEGFLNFSQDACRPYCTSRPIEVLYAGNIGDGQGLHLIIPKLAAQLGSRVNFRIIGAGGKLETLRQALREANLSNVELIEPVERQLLLGIYTQADVLFLHLNDFRAFRRVLPSKLFEYAATGKPILAGVAGYAAEFVSTGIKNAAVFPPCDIQAAAKALENLQIAPSHRAEFIENHQRSRIMKKMARDLLSLI